eukprot:m.13729 g.13729  ORF g.13729 m.13729 type:complete len:435 (+) comp4704_c0_seq1:40-1344(+)
MVVCLWLGALLRTVPGAVVPAASRFETIGEGLSYVLPFPTPNHWTSTSNQAVPWVLGPLRAGPAPPKPQLPTQWSAPFSFSEAGFKSNNGRFNQDGVNQRYAYSFVDNTLPGRTPIPVPVGTEQTWAMMANATVSTTTVNDVCRIPSPTAHFVDLFGWVSEPASVYLGPTTYEGRACDVWATSSDPKTAAVELCVDAQNNPVGMVTRGHGEATTLSFGLPLTRGPPPESAFQVPSTCGHPGPTCENGANVPLEAVVFHPTHQLDIAGQDVADRLGDTMFLCLAGPNASSAGQQYTEISLWDLEVWSGFGQYSLCNGYPPTCMGNDNFNVGKEASTGFKPGCGQCTDNSGDFGSWYSLAAKGECTSGGPPDGKHCTWRRIRRRKTVSVLCPSFAGFFAKCAAETAIPFTAASASLGQIFASETVADGGCPALPYP